MSDDLEPAAPVVTGDTICDGRFKLLEQLGVGGSAVVYRAHDLIADENVAVKVGRLPGDTDPQLLHQYRKMRRLHSSSIAVCLGYFLHCVGVSQFSVLAFELVEGATLQEYLTGVSQARRVEVARLIALALDELAVVGLRHGDVWAQNILVRGDIPVLIDPDSDGPGSLSIHHGKSDFSRFVDLLIKLGVTDRHLERVLRDCGAQERPFLASAEALNLARIDAVANDRDQRLATLRVAYARESSANAGRYAALVTGRRAAFTGLVRRVEDVLGAVALPFTPFDPTEHDSAMESERQGTSTGLGDLRHLALTFRTPQGRFWELLLRGHQAFTKPSPFDDTTILGIANSMIRVAEDVPEISDTIALRTDEGALRFSLETPYGWTNLPADWELRSLETMLGHRIAAFPSHRQLQGPKQDPTTKGFEAIHDELISGLEIRLRALAQSPRSQWKPLLSKVFEEEFLGSWAIWFASIARFDLVRTDDQWNIELNALLADHAVTPVTWRFGLPGLSSSRQRQR